MFSVFFQTCNVSPITIVTRIQKFRCSDDNAATQQTTPHLQSVIERLEQGVKCIPN